MRCPTLSELPPPPPGKTGWPWTEESEQLPDTMPDGSPWPRVSIVTPSYNQGQFIEETIRSVLLQGYPDLEYIIIDGGSTDGSVDIIRKYEPWLAYWVSEPDRGQAHAINKGWARATGDILAYINSDDYYVEGAVSAIVEGFRVHPGVGLIYGTAIVVDETGREMRIWEAQPFDLKKMLAVTNIVPQPAAFLSRAALEETGYLNEDLEMILDYELYIRIGMRFPAVCIPRVLAKFRDHSRSKTRTRFEVTARELIEFGASFFGRDALPADVAAVRRATLSRYHYALSVAYVSQGREQARRGLKPLIDSMLLSPKFALMRPLQTAYILKEILLGYVKVFGSSLHTRQG